MNTTIIDIDLMKILSYVSLYLMRYGLLVMIILGLTGNILTILVFRQPRLRYNPCSFYLISAAYANILWILLCPFVRIISTFGLDFLERINVLCKIHQSLSYTLSSLSMISVALATVDRFLISSTRFQYRHLSSLRSAHRLVAFTTIVCCIIFADMIYCLNVTGKPPREICTSTTTRICGLYNEIARILALTLIPCLLIIIFGLRTIQNIHKSRRNTNITKRCKSIHRTDRQLIQMIISQSLLIIISYIPNITQRIYLVFTSDIQRSSLSYKKDMLIGDVTLFFTTFQSSFSFLIYITTGGQLFRQALKILLKPITPECCVSIKENELENTLELCRLKRQLKSEL